MFNWLEKMKALEIEEEEIRQEGRAEGYAQGESRLSSLINVLIRSGRNDDILRAASDAGYRKQLYQELNIQ